MQGSIQTSASSFWAQLRGHLATLGYGIVATLRYLFFFEWVVDFARWLITTGGNIAESAFLLATVYVTINTVAHQLVLWLLPQSAIVTLNQVSVIAFSVLPELIIFAAIKVTFDHFKMALSSKRIDAWVWSIMYALPTLVFLILTIITISSFVSVEATSTNAPQATGAMLVTRCLAGWSYGMLQMLWSRLGHEGYSHLFARLRDEIASLKVTVAARDGSISGLEQEKAGLQASVTALNSTLVARDGAIADLQSQGVNADRLLKSRDSKIAELQVEVEELKEQNTTLDGELVEARMVLARKSGSVEDETEEALSEAVISSEKYQTVKKLMQKQLVNGEKINMKKISSDTGISYNTVRRYAQSVLNGLVESKAA